MNEFELDPNPRGYPTEPPLERVGEARARMTLPQTSAERKDFPLFRGVARYFPAALAAVAQVSKVGNDKHNPGQPMHHARGKSSDHPDCILRHLVDLGENGGIEPGSGLPQVAFIAWRALALAQEWLEANDGAPLAPGACLPGEEPSE